MFRYTSARSTDVLATIDSERSGASVTLGNESIADTSTGRSTPPIARQLGGQHEQVRRVGQRRQRPGEHEREGEPGRRRLVELVELHHLVLEPEHRPRVDVERQVQVDRAAARLLGVQVDLPQLAQRVGLDEVPLVVDVEAVIDRLALQIGDESGDVNDRHWRPLRGAPYLCARCDTTVLPVERIAVVAFDVGETLVDETRIWSRWADRLGVTRLTMLGVLGAMAALDRPHEDAFEIVRPGIDLERRAGPLAGRRSRRVCARTSTPTTSTATCAACFAAPARGGSPRRSSPATSRRRRAPRWRRWTSASTPSSSPTSSARRSRRPRSSTPSSSCAGVVPARIAYVGDRLDNDVLPARRAGMRTVLLRRGPWGHVHAERPDAALADIVTGSLAELAGAARTRSAQRPAG